MLVDLKLMLKVCFNLFMGHIVLMTLLLTYRVNDKDEVDDDNQRMIVPRIPTGISGTALAASLLRDGWSVSGIFELILLICFPLSVYFI